MELSKVDRVIEALEHLAISIDHFVITCAVITFASFILLFAAELRNRLAEKKRRQELEAQFTELLEAMNERFWIED